MPCKVTPNAIICSGRQTRRSCRWCGTESNRMCDYPVPEKASGTCDAPICWRCATQVGPDKDMCPGHVLAWKAKGRATTVQEPRA